MKTQVKIIRFVAIMSIVLAVITYLITVNIEVGFIRLNTQWLSNNFLLTVCGGAFASMLVVLLCEIQKYFEIKKSTEAIIFKHLRHVCIQLVSLDKLIKECLENPTRVVPNGILSFSTEAIRSAIGELRVVEYDTFFKKSKLKEAFSTFQKNALVDIQYYTMYEKYLSIAMSEDQIAYINEHGEKGTITSSSTKTNYVLKKLDTMVNKGILNTWNFMHTMDELCDKRFGFIDGSKNEHGSSNQTKFMSFEEFMKNEF